LSLTLLIKRARWPLLLHQFTNSALGAWWWQKPPQCLKELINLLVLHMCRWSRRIWGSTWMLTTRCLSPYVVVQLQKH
jgi:hypothetical protein